jgi:hypothetical protein
MICSHIRRGSLPSSPCRKEKRGCCLTLEAQLRAPAKRELAKDGSQSTEDGRVDECPSVAAFVMPRPAENGAVEEPKHRSGASAGVVEGRVAVEWLGRVLRGMAGTAPCDIEKQLNPTTESRWVCVRARGPARVLAVLMARCTMMSTTSLARDRKKAKSFTASRCRHNA